MFSSTVWFRMIGSPLLRTLATRSTARLDRSIPFFNNDLIFSKFPKLVPDKVAYMTGQVQGSFAAGFLFVFLVFNPPFQGADYENSYKSWLYQWTRSRLESSGQLYENVRVKRDYFYSPGGPVDPMIKVAEHEE